MVNIQILKNKFIFFKIKNFDFQKLLKQYQEMEQREIKL